MMGRESRPQVHYEGDRGAIWAMTLDRRHRLLVEEHTRTLGVHCRICNGQYAGFHVLAYRRDLEVVRMPYDSLGD